MRKIATMLATILSLGALVIAVSTGAQARFGGTTIADAVAEVASTQAVQYYGGYRSYRPYYAPRYYNGGGYYDYRRYGYPGSRDSLNTCAYC